MGHEIDFDSLHISVLLEELVDAMKPSPDTKNIIVDATLGMAGHAIHVIQQMKQGDIFVGFDADEQNLQLAKKRIDALQSPVTIHLVHSNFVGLKEELKKLDIESITGIYYDLGLSSLHLDEPERGFSFQEDGPLDMRLDKSTGRTAADIVNGYKREDLREIFLEFGEEPAANKISSRIVDERKKKKFTRTKELSDFIHTINTNKKTKARIFQALRIEVNQELENIKKSLEDGIQLLESGGNIFAISFHSGEDRVVKNIFKRESRDCYCKDMLCTCQHTKQVQLLHKKPIVPTEKEIQQNPRSRSAKARHARKI